jgi:DNA-binding NarL/FixJ family response regulator
MPTFPDKPIRILLVDDHALVREMLRSLIEEQPEMAVVGEAQTGSEALSLAALEEPDIILLDLDLGGESGLDSLQALLALSKKPRILVLTGGRDPQMHRQAIYLGAMGFLLKDETAEVLIKAIKKVHEGEAWLDRSMTAAVLSEITRSKKEDPEAAKINTLTEREREVIALIAEAVGTKQIADRLFISEKTVRNHLASIFSKLELSDRLELAIYASRHGLTDPARKAPSSR